MSNFFPGDTSNIKTIPSSSYSVSHYFHAKWLAMKIIENYGTKITVADVCSNVGGNALGFLLAGISKVISYEIDPEGYLALKHNISLYKFPGEHIAILGDANAQDYTEIDVFFIDPPWGGKEYKKNKKMTLYIGSSSIREFINKHARDKPVFLKAPLNFDTPELKKGTGRSFQSFIMKTKSGRPVYQILWSQ